MINFIFALCLFIFVEVQALALPRFSFTSLGNSETIPTAFTTRDIELIPAGTLPDPRPALLISVDTPNPENLYIAFLGPDSTIEETRTFQIPFNLRRCVVPLGDINNDGQYDLLLGGFDMIGLFSLDFSTTPFSLRDTTMRLNHPFMETFGQRYGESCVNLGDLNQDGIPDLAISANEQRFSGVTNVGIVYIEFLTSTFTRAQSSIAILPSDNTIQDLRFGEEIEFLGDNNLNGLVEIAVFSQNRTTENDGFIEIFEINLAQPVRLQTWGESQGFNLPEAIVGWTNLSEFSSGRGSPGEGIRYLGDLTGDGNPEILLGMPERDRFSGGAANVGGFLFGSFDPQTFLLTHASVSLDFLSPSFTVSERYGEALTLLPQASPTSPFRLAIVGQTSFVIMDLPFCGEGVLTNISGLREMCDDGNNIGGDGCSPTCELIEMGWQCLTPGQPCTPICGDGLRVGVEECDDGDADGGDGCSSACFEEAGFACDNSPGMPSVCVRVNALTDAEISGIVVSVVFVFCVCLALSVVMMVFLIGKPKVSMIPLPNDIPQLDGIEIKEKIGSGNFGVIYRGLWKGDEVALKTLQPENPSFLTELTLLLELRNQHVLAFYGVYIHRETYYMVIEYMEKKDLQSYLQKTPEIDHTDMISFTEQTVRGMSYLHSRKIIHRDLAVRNLLLSGSLGKFTVKISDFGLSRKTENYYTTESKTVPVRWTAPEAIEYGKFTEASDIWSFGVVIFEIFSRGAVPYAGLSNKKVFEKVSQGLRLEIPAECPIAFGRIMTQCFHSEPEQRPSFSEILKKIDQGLSIEFATDSRFSGIFAVGETSSTVQNSYNEALETLKEENKVLRSQLQKIQTPASLPPKSLTSQKKQELQSYMNEIRSLKEQLKELE